MESQGARLKKIRLEKGLSLEEVQKKTRIHLNILKGIEGESLTNLNPVYLKSFLKIYCKFLGVDPKDYISDYQEGTVKENSPAAAAKEPRAALKESGPAINLGAITPSKKAVKIFVFLLIGIFLLLGLFNLGKNISRKRTKGVTPQKYVLPVKKTIKIKKTKEETVVEKTRPIAVVPKAISQEPLPKKETLLKPDAGIRLTIRARENCWIYLKADGRVLFQRILEKGRFESWQAKEKIELSIGNAGAVELEVNGQIFSNLGRKGQPRKDILITKDGLNLGR